MKILTNKQMALRDGTPAYESIIKIRNAGFLRSKSHHLAVYKDGHMIRISIFTGEKYYNEISDDLKKILYSLEFF